MSKPVVAFTTEGNWQRVYVETRQAVIVSDKITIPIPAFEVGFLFSEHILAIKATSLTAKPTWRYAGSIYQRLQLGAGGTASSLPEVDLSTKSIQLNRAMLLDLPRYTMEFGLVFLTPPWMISITLAFWQYSGIDSDTVTDLVTAAREDLARIEAKVDALP